MKLYAAMVFGIAIGTGIALIMAAREFEDTAPATTPLTPSMPSMPPPSPASPASPAMPPTDRPMGA